MKRDFFRNLTSEIIIDILSRLPIRTIISCKFVCKSWLDLIETHEFAKSHLSKSVPSLAVYQFGIDSKLYRIFEFEDVFDLEHHELHYKPVIKFNFPCAAVIQGSANGLLFLRDLSLDPNGLYICNPITHEYIEFHCPQEFVYSYLRRVTYGFGVSKMTGQHKVVGIFHDFTRDQETHAVVSIPKSECQVYTLGKRSWKRIAPGAPVEYGCHTIGAFLNGNPHWLVSDLKGYQWISCFDLETELFSIFSLPLPNRGRFVAGVFALEDCLCFCDNTADDDIVIWLMKEYGIERSWTKEFVISKIPDFAGFSYEVIFPIKVFKDGDILIAWEEYCLVYYSEKNKTIQKIDMFESVYSILHTSSFLSLKSFAMEKVNSF